MSRGERPRFKLRETVRCLVALYVDLGIDCGLATWAGIGGHGALAYCDLIHFSTTKKSRAHEQKGRQRRRG